MSSVLCPGCCCHVHLIKQTIPFLIFGLTFENACLFLVSFFLRCWNVVRKLRRLCNERRGAQLTAAVVYTGRNSYFPFKSIPRMSTRLFPSLVSLRSFVKSCIGNCAQMFTCQQVADETISRFAFLGDGGFRLPVQPMILRMQVPQVDFFSGRHFRFTHAACI